MSKQVNVKVYPKDFKEQVVKLAQVGDRSATQIAREFEISRESVRRWVKQAELDQGSRTDGLRSKDRDELARPAVDTQIRVKPLACTNRCLASSG